MTVLNIDSFRLTSQSHPGDQPVDEAFFKEVTDKPCKGLAGYPGLENITLGDLFCFLKDAGRYNSSALHMHRRLALEINNALNNQSLVAANETRADAAARKIIQEFNNAFCEDKIYPNSDDKHFLKICDSIEVAGIKLERGMISLYPYYENVWDSLLRLTSDVTMKLAARKSEVDIRQGRPLV
ncbi:MAG: hypothetical protein U1E36_02885 [Rickettsiales bacterium]